MNFVNRVKKLASCYNQITRSPKSVNYNIRASKELKHSISFFFSECHIIKKNQHTLRINKKVGMNCMTHKQSHRHTRPPSLKHLPCLTKSSLSPYFSPSTWFFQVAPRKLKWAAARSSSSSTVQQLQYNCRCTGHGILTYNTLQYTTAPTTCNEQVQYWSGRPAESSSIAP